MPEHFLYGENHRIETPDGQMFVTIAEDVNGKPALVQVNIGKSGTALSAWANATAELISVCLQAGVPLDTLIEILSDITSDGRARIAIGDNVQIRSGPMGIWAALVRYRKNKKESRTEVINERSMHFKVENDDARI